MSAWRRAGLVTASLTALAACKQQPVQVSNTETSDYGREQLLQAVAQFVAAERTPVAYAALSKRIFELVPTMDKTVANEAELKLTVLALAPMRAAQDQPIEEQAAALATTVWPTAFADRPLATTQLRAAEGQSAEVWPRAYETPRAYALRVCAGPLSQVCRDTVPEQHDALLLAHAVHRFTERARSAVSDCLSCSTDPSWRAAVRGWDELDAATNSWVHEVEKRGLPSNWPVAGPAAEPDAELPHLELSELGEFLVDSRPLSRHRRHQELREALRGSPEVALHVRPDTTLARLRELAHELRKLGVTSIALVSRDAKYPWSRRLYRLSLGRGRRVTARGNDTVQILL